MIKTDNNHLNKVNRLDLSAITQNEMTKSRKDAIELLKIIKQKESEKLLRNSK